MSQRAALLLVLCMASTGCVAGAKLREDALLIGQKVNTARERGAYRCAPKELAQAEAHLEFLSYELDEGDFRRADWHQRAALESINRALEITNPDECADKRVLINEATDTDNDGILDALDKCPNEPEDKDLFQDEDGCPDPDNDADGVLDVADKCPMDPGPQENNGCPATDRDQDTVPDNVDQCPDIPEDLDGKNDQDGCPEQEDLDGDGITDDVDKCPTQPEDKDGFLDEDGCPEPDNDNDTILDLADACPNEAGPVATNGCPVHDRDGDGLTDDIDQCPDVPGAAPTGCPKKVLVVKTATKIEIKQQINFDNGKSTIKGATSFEILSQVAAVMKSNPDIKIVIEGHTDSVGDAAKNLKLSDGRANAVRAALIERGVEASRAEAVGYGESKPIASNKNAKGRATNRRVEFNIVPTTPAPEAAPVPAATP